jgi:hypothetical protein
MTLVLEPVLRIRDILVRIRIRGSAPLTNGSGFRLLCSQTVVYHDPVVVAYTPRMAAGV